MTGAWGRVVREGGGAFSAFLQMYLRSRTTSLDSPFDVELQLKSDVISDTPWNTAEIKADETYRKTEVLFCIDIKRDRYCTIWGGTILSRQRFGDLGSRLRGLRYVGGGGKVSGAEGERPRLRADNDVTPEGYPVGPELWLACRKRVDKKITWLSARRGESADRVAARRWIDNAPRVASKLSSLRRLIRRIRAIAMYRKAFADENGLYPGVEWRRHVPPVRSNLRHHPAATLYPFTRPSLSRPFPRAAMCFSSVLTVGELVAANNIVTVNFARRNSI